MVIYTCHKCNKEFLNKTDFKRHINRKFTCNTNFNNKPDNTAEIAVIIPNKFVCKDCNKIFSRKFTLERHINLNRCKNIKSNENINLNLKISELESKIEKLLNDRNINSNTNITNNNITNNNNNITNNITNNIIIKFGYEHKSDGLTNDEIIRIVNKGCMSLCESIKLTHFNTRLPQLHNIYIPDKKFKNICTFNGELFELNKSEDVLHELVDKHVYNIQKYLNMNLKYEKNILPIVKQFLNKINEINEIYDDSKINKFKNDDKISEILYFLYNNRKLIIQNYKNISKL